MPEGDTIHRIAVNLGPRLIGKVLERVTTQGLARQIAGTTVTAVTAVGKHLVIDVDSGAYLRMHLGMYGRQRSYPRREGEAMLGRMSPGRVSLALVTADDVHLWIGARTVEISDRRAPLHGHAIRSGKPCRRCQGVISCYQLGNPPRWTWSCADCQPQGGARS